MKTKKILKIIGVVLIILIVILVIWMIRKYAIISGLQDKISKYANTTNYHIQSTLENKNGKITTTDYYKKDNNQAMFITKNENGKTVKVSLYSNNNKTNMYIESEDRKSSKISETELVSLGIYNYLESDSKWQAFIGSIFSKIKSVNYDGKECYSIRGFTSLTSLPEENSEIYVEKDTGLCVRTIEGDTATDKKYEFNNVNDSIFEEPNINDYRIEEDK